MQLNQAATDKISGLLVSPMDATKQQFFSCPECNGDVVFCKGNIIQPYFRHKSCNILCDRFTKESYEHLLAKHKLKTWLTDRINMTIIRNCQKCNNEFAWEIPPLDPDTDIIDEFAFIHNGKKCRADIACIQKDKTIDIVFEVCNTNPTMVDKRPEPWYEIKSNEICSIPDDNNNIVLHCIRNSFIDNQYGYCNNCEGSKIYFNQRGAGCGKTFESIQLINSDQFNSKNTFIYLTKMNSAKDVIYNELLSQFNNGFFNSNCQILNANKNGNQYVVNINKNNNNIVVIIGTIDSFTYAIRKRNYKEFDGANMFKDIVNDICVGNMSINMDGTIKYAKTSTKLASDCIVIIDEGQDLEKEYIDAFDKIIDRTGIDTYIIGDKLQSILSEKNLYTHLENASGNRLIKTIGENVVKRFHNNQFIPFVNRICKFTEHGLPEITGICSNPKCKYAHENDIVPYTVNYNCPNIYNATPEEVADYINLILNDMKSKINSYGYLPNNFCFIFPVVKSTNRIISQLFPALQFFWIDFFSSETSYTAKVLENMQNNKEYWENKILLRHNDTRYYQYVYWHSSEQNGVIDLTESSNGTRIMSIHSSKGTGCECVYLLGLSDMSLGRFSGGISNTLVYESLLHVGLTRQKKYLWVGLIKGNDSITKRFQNLVTNDTEVSNVPSLNNISKFMSTNYISDKYLLCEEHKDVLQNSYYKSFINSKCKNTIDYGHHTIRYAVLKLNAFKHLLTSTKPNQMHKIIDTLINGSEINYVFYREYKAKLYELNKTIKTNIDNYYKNKPLQTLKIPVLSFSYSNKGNTDYDKYSKVVKSLCKTVIQKLKNKEYNFCPFESMIFCHLIELSHKPYNISVNIIDIYKILSNYNDSPIEHNGCQCCCNNYFIPSQNNNNTDFNIHSNIKNSIINHHSAVSKIDKIMETLINSNNYKNLEYKINNDPYCGEDIKIVTNIDIFAQINENSAVCVKILPQFNSINYSKEISKIMFDSYVLFLKHRFTSIKNYIITLDCDSPIEIHNFDFSKISLFVSNTIYNNFVIHHNKIKDYVGHNINIGKNLLDIVNTIKSNVNKEFDKLPEYIVKTIETIDESINNEECDINTIIDTDYLINKLNSKLRFEIKKLTGVQLKIA